MPQPANPAEVTRCVMSRGFPADADTLHGLFMYNEINGGDPTLDCDQGRTHYAGDVLPAVWPERDDRPARRRVQERARLVQRHRSGDEAAAKQSTRSSRPISRSRRPTGSPAPTTISVPLATRMTTQAPQHSWASPLPDFAANIRTDRALGRRACRVRADRRPERTVPADEVLAGRSQRSLVQPGSPWVTTLIYQSTTDPNGYYIAFEDQPMCTASWHGCTPGSQTQVEPQWQRRRLQRLRLLRQRARLRGRRSSLRHGDAGHLRRRDHPVLERRNGHQVPAGHPGAAGDLQPPRRRLRRHHRQPGRPRPLPGRAGLQPGRLRQPLLADASFPAVPLPSATRPTGSARTRRA